MDSRVGNDLRPSYERTFHTWSSDRARLPVRSLENTALRFREFIRFFPAFSVLIAIRLRATIGMSSSYCTLHNAQMSRNYHKQKIHRKQCSTGNYCVHVQFKKKSHSHARSEEEMSSKTKIMYFAEDKRVQLNNLEECNGRRMIPATAFLMTTFGLSR